jgi:hypothetical protein
MLREIVAEVIGAQPDMAAVEMKGPERLLPGGEPLDALVIGLEGSSGGPRPPPTGLPPHRRLYGLTTEGRALFAWQPNRGWLELGDISPARLVEVLRHGV